MVTILPINYLKRQGILNKTLFLCLLLLLSVSSSLHAFHYTDVPTGFRICNKTAANEYKVCWDKNIADADEYQLEWVHVNNYSEANKPAPKLPYNFRFNSTRISTKDCFYSVASVFEKGTVLFRIRAIKYTETGQIIAGKWSNEEAGDDAMAYTGAKISITNSDIHTADKLNWQYIANYAEGGKKKEVISYYDGSMRSHQMVTRINSDEKSAIVGETFYDHQGRAAMQALPVPADDSRLQYYKNFNQSSNGVTYGRNNFDKSSEAPCSVLADTMARVSGASRYYSPNNPDVNTGFNRFIPDAGGYPFSQTEYEPDNTGRIRRQGGVGQKYQLGSKHETKYFYGKPAQEELNRMFASEVGYNSHYQKNVVHDANGQLSVSYLDMQGKVIATSLAGGTPEGMDSLRSKQNGKRLEINIIDNQPIAVGANKYTSVYHHLSTTADTHNFTYSLPASSFSSIDDISLPKDTCLDCIYDLVIDIKNECGERPTSVKITSAYDTTKVSGLPVRITLGSMDSIVCGKITKDIKFTFDAYLNVGKYTISRTISVNNDAHIDNYLNTHTKLVNMAEVIREKIAEVNFDLCEEPKTCEEKCLDKDNPEECILNCRLGSEYINTCSLQENMLASDYIPTVVKPTDDKGTTTWPDFKKEAGDSGQYALYKINDDGSYTYYDESSVFSPTEKAKVLNSNIGYIFRDGEGNELGIKEIVESFNPEWATLLAKLLHPERSCLEACNEPANELSQRYDFIIRYTDSYEEAYKRGLLNPLGPKYGTLAYLDPFFATGGKGYGKRNEILSYMNSSFVYGQPPSSLTIWEQAVYMAYRAELDVTVSPETEQQYIAKARNYEFNPQLQKDNNVECVCVRDRVWEYFRALYLGKKGGIEANLEGCRSSIPTGKTQRIQASYYTEKEKEIINTSMTKKDDLINLGVDPDAKVKDICTQQAEAQANNILKQLEGCLDITKKDASDTLKWNKYNPQYKALREAFVNIMIQTCDGGHMFGASNLPSGATPVQGGYYSFADAMTGILRDTGDTTKFTLRCNPDLITFPKPYDYEYNSYTNYKVIDSCGCNTLLQANAEYEQEKKVSGKLPKGITSGQKYFAWKYGYTIDNYLAKLCLCTNAFKTVGNNSWNTEAKAMLKRSHEYIPTELNCDVCIDCRDIQLAMADFNAKPWVKKLSIFTSLFDTGLDEYNRQRMLTNYLNNRFNLNKSYLDYMELSGKCKATSQNPYCELTPEALSLQKLLNEVIIQGEITGRGCEPISKAIKESKIFPVAAGCCEEYSFEPTVINSNTVSIKIAGQEGCNKTDCEITLQFTDTKPGYNLSNIVPLFENIRAVKEPSSSSDNKYYFHIDAHVAYKGSVDKTVLLGSVCFPIEECYDENSSNITLCDRKTPEPNLCKENLVRVVVETVKTQYKEYTDSITNAFRDMYTNKCLANTGGEIFKMKFIDSERHYTLYYYDQAGNLVKTIPPEGVELITNTEVLKQINDDRKYRIQTVFTNHRMATRYLYNSLNQLVAQYMPDHEAFDGKSVKQGYGLPPGMDISSTAFADDDNGILFGIDPEDKTKGLIYTTADGGASWSAVKTSGVKSLNAVCKVPGVNALWAVGNAGTIATAVDGGDWVTKIHPDKPDFIGINMVDANNGYIFTRDGRIYRKINDGNWSSAGRIDNTNTNIILEKVYFKDPASGIAVGSDDSNSTGVVYETTDNIKWELQTPKKLPKVTAVHMLSNTQGYAICENGLIMETIDGGNSWKQKNRMSSSPAPVIRKIHFFTPDRAIAIDKNNYLITTSNGGYSWAVTNLIYSRTAVTDFSVVPGTGIAYAVANENGANYLYKMNGAGSYWIKELKATSPEPVTIPTGDKITGLYYSSATRAYAVTSGGKILKTFDGWQSHLSGGSLESAVTEALSISEKNANTLIVVTPSRKWNVVSSEDGITAQPTDNAATYTATALIPGSNNAIVAANGSLFVDSNLSLPKPIVFKPMNNVYALGNLSVAVGDNGTILYRNGSGSNNLWTIASTPFRDNLLSACVKTGNAIVVGSVGGKLYVNEDILSSASSWQANDYNSAITDIAYLANDGISLIATEDGDIYPKADGVYTTNSMREGNANGKRINDILVYDSNRVITVGNEGEILTSQYPAAWASETGKRADALFVDAAQTPDGTLYAITHSANLGYAIEKSTDGGVSWVPQWTGSNELKSIEFVDENTGLVAGAGIMLKTTDGGNNWNSFGNAGSHTLNDVYMDGAGKYYTVGNNGVILSSAGSQSVNGDISGTNLNAVYFLKGKNIGFIAGDNGLILKTTDGKKWEIMKPDKTKPDTTNWVTYLWNNPSKPSSLYGIYAADPVTAYAAGDGGVLLKSIDGGVTWSSRESNTGNGLTQMQVKTDGTLVLSGNSSAMLQYRDGTDGFSMRFYYDRLGRLVASQNSKQHSMYPQRYSYTVYDPIGRVVEAGEIEAGQEPTQELMRNPNFPANWGGNRYQLTRTVYDRSISTTISNQFTGKEQQNLRNRVASVIYQDTYSDDNTVYNHATHYSYDIHGNVKELIQDNPELALLKQQYKKLHYDYDLVSGNVNMVSYQKGAPDQFYHRYEYDADNRITRVYTSPNGSDWENDASYQYYKHGPLARTELGQNKVQGVDYAYTLQGWIKGVNSPTLTLPGTSTPLSDQGACAQDVFGYSLHYNKYDYKPINSAADFFSAVSAGAPMVDLYNGNISRMATALSEKIPNAQAYNFGTQVSDFKYDELNRLVASTKVSGKGADNAYATTYSYDANGNIETLTRKDGNGQPMDNLAYHYTKDGNDKILNNRLLHVNDGAQSAPKLGDIYDQGAYAQNDLENLNYAYDKIGNLIKDNQEEIAEIKWNVQGKVQAIIRKAESQKSNLYFTYDAMGNRVSKTEQYKVPVGGVSAITTYYVRDAQGNVMAVYEDVKRSSSESFALKEQHLYGSSRLGIRQVNLALYPSVVYPQTTEKNYELTNHLGNVLAVVSDKKETNGDAKILSATDFYPFGMPLVGRVYKGDGYRYGFNGQEKTLELNPSHTTALFWEYDGRLGKRWNVDPLADHPKNISISPYAVFKNNPILLVDPMGAIWDSSSVAGVNQTLTEINTMCTSLNNQISQINASPAGIDNGNTTLTTNQQNQIGELQFRINNLNSAVAEINSMSIDRNNIFVLNPINGGYAQTLADPMNLNRIIISYYAEDIGNKLHEIKHGHQVLTGDLRFTLNGPVGYNMGDEIAAWTRQYSYIGQLTGSRAPALGEQTYLLNQLSGTLGTPRQINTQYNITNHSQITIPFLRSVTTGPTPQMTNDRLYPSIIPD